MTRLRDDFSENLGAWRIEIRSAEKCRRQWLLQLRTLNPKLAEAVQARAGTLIGKQINASLTPLESLVIERYLATWMAMVYFQWSIRDVSGKSAILVASAETAFRRANRDHRRAVTMLKVVREFLAKGASASNGRPTGQRRDEFDKYSKYG